MDIAQTPSISQAVIAEYFDIQQERLELERKARKLKDKEDFFKNQMIHFLKQGYPVQDGDYTVRLKAGARYPKWKEEFAKRLGEEEVSLVIANTPYTESIEVEVQNPGGYLPQGNA